MQASTASSALHWLITVSHSGYISTFAWLQICMLRHFLFQIRARTKVGYGDNSTVIIVQLSIGT